MKKNPLNHLPLPTYDLHFSFFPRQKWDFFQDIEVEVQGMFIRPLLTCIKQQQ